MTSNIVEKRIGVGTGIMIMSRGKVLLGKRHEDPDKATSLLKGAGTWTMPGGKMDFGESFEECGKRETMEETGLILNKVTVLCINNDVVETAHFITVGLFCDDFTGVPQVKEPDKITQWHWFEIDKLPEPMYFPSLRIIENYKQGKFYLTSQCLTPLQKTPR